ncbi:unnamed protein product [Ambrosiozyma monospora]|uniref:Unnamed protein product n=1 Tax=Ambrosiozyma monospora TaxID=43982 RepID=A0ACB5TRL9_AMBMO|nr:unnamed protein product [Ambrosiozyma monospora]
MANRHSKGKGKGKGNLPTTIDNTTNSHSSMADELAPLSTENLSIHNILSSGTETATTEAAEAGGVPTHSQPQASDTRAETDDAVSGAATQGQDDVQDDDDDTDYTYETDLVNPQDVQKEWEQSIAQLVTLVNFVLIPLVGKIIGRKFAHTIWNKIAEKIW